MKQPIKNGIVLCILAAVIFVLQLFTFTEPTVAPPAGNVTTPLNVGSLGQSKTGGIILNAGGGSGTPGFVFIEW